MCPTMKYVSWMKTSTGVEAMNTPERPPMTNIETNEIAISIGVVKRMFPPHTVPSQLNVLIADGTAMTIVEIMNDVPRMGFMPLWNTWWPHTIHPRPAMPSIEYAMARYPKIGLREKTGRISEVMPMAGRIMM